MKTDEEMIREYAERRFQVVVGQLTRRPELESEVSGSRTRAYSDEGGNAYYILKAWVFIYTKAGRLI